jgi:hypothetical protein
VLAVCREWYGLSDAPGRNQRRDEIEAEVVCLLRDNRATLPGISSLKRDCANVSFFPSTIDTLFLRAFPPTADDRARLRGEWDLLDRVAARVGTLSASGDGAGAEALRKGRLPSSTLGLPMTRWTFVSRRRREERLGSNRP